MEGSCSISTIQDIHDIAHQSSSLSIRVVEKEKDGQIRIELKQPPLPAHRSFYSPFDTKDIYQIRVAQRSPSCFKVFFCSCCAWSKPLYRMFCKDKRMEQSKHLVDYCYHLHDKSSEGDYDYTIDIHLPSISLLQGQLQLITSHHVCDNRYLSLSVFKRLADTARKLHSVLFHEGALQHSVDHANAYITSDMSLITSPRFSGAIYINGSIEEIYRKYESFAKKCYHSSTTVVFWIRPSASSINQACFQFVSNKSTTIGYFFSLRCGMYTLTDVDRFYISPKDFSRSIVSKPAVEELTKYTSEYILQQKDTIRRSLSTERPNEWIIFFTKLYLAYKEPSVDVMIKLLSSVRMHIPPQYILQESLLFSTEDGSLIYIDHGFLYLILHSKMSKSLVGYLPQDQHDHYYLFQPEHIVDSSYRRYLSSLVYDLFSWSSHFALCLKVFDVMSSGVKERTMGYEANKLRKKCPAYLLTFGSIVDESEKIYVCKEVVPCSDTLRSFLEEKHPTTLLFDVLLQIVCASAWAYHRHHFVYGKLNTMSIVVHSRESQDPLYFDYHVESEKIVLPIATHVVLFGDYEKSIITTDRLQYVQDLSTFTRSIMFELIVSHPESLLDARMKTLYQLLIKTCILLTDEEQLMVFESIVQIAKDTSLSSTRRLNELTNACPLFEPSFKTTQKFSSSFFSILGKRFSVGDMIKKEAMIVTIE